MKHKAIAIIIFMSFGVFSVSCYSIKPIDPRLSSSRKAGATFIVTKIDGTIIEGELITVKQNSILLLGASSGEDESIRFEDINTLETVKKSGLYWGAGLGLALGAIGGGVMGHQSANPLNSGSFIERDVTTTLFVGACGALVGGLIGAGIGNSISGPKTFKIKGKPQEEVSAVMEKLRTKARVSDYQ